MFSFNQSLTRCGLLNCGLIWLWLSTKHKTGAGLSIDYESIALYCVYSVAGQLPGVMTGGKNIAPEFSIVP